MASTSGVAEAATRSLLMSIRRSRIHCGSMYVNNLRSTATGFTVRRRARESSQEPSGLARAFHRPDDPPRIKIDDDDLLVMADVETPSVGVRAGVVPSVVARHRNLR